MCPDRDIQIHNCPFWSENCPDVSFRCYNDYNRIIVFTKSSQRRALFCCSLLGRPPAGPIQTSSVAPSVHESVASYVSNPQYVCLCGITSQSPTLVEFPQAGFIRILSLSMSQSHPVRDYEPVSQCGITSQSPTLVRFKR